MAARYGVLSLMLALAMTCFSGQALAYDVNLEDPNLAMASPDSNEGGVLCSEVGFGRCYQISHNALGFVSLEVSDTLDITRSLTASIDLNDSQGAYLPNRMPSSAE